MRSKEAVERRAKKRGISVTAMWKLEQENVKKGVDREKQRRKLMDASGPTEKEGNAKAVGDVKQKIVAKEKIETAVDVKDIVKDVIEDVKADHEDNGDDESSDNSSVSSDNNSVSSSSSSSVASSCSSSSGDSPTIKTPLKPIEPGSWVCGKCGNENFARRMVCNTKTCRAPRPEGSKSGGSEGAGEKRKAAEEKKVEWKAQASEEQIVVNMELRRRYKDPELRGKMSEEELGRGKALVERDERKKIKKQKRSLEYDSAEETPPQEKQRLSDVGSPNTSRETVPSMTPDISNQASPGEDLDMEEEVLSDASYSSGDVEVADAASPRKVNPSGKPPEAGIIVKVYVENFMCHKKMSIPLCHNVNFIHGQNGSGKSAVLAAIQICLGAGARRTNRAKTLAKLINNHGKATHAKLQVKLLNKGSDSFQHDVYGDYITVERILDKSGGSNYRLLDSKDKVKSKKKADLDAMLDLFNIQVDNPVAVLDQEESKKFLKGRPEDKYAFFCKATELERIDRHYAVTKDYIDELEESRADLVKQLRPQREIVQKLETEWEECQKLEKLEAKVSQATCNISWALVNAMEGEHDKVEEKLSKAKEDLAKFDQKVTNFIKEGQGNEGDQENLEATIERLSGEANEAVEAKREQEQELKALKKPKHAIENEIKNLQRSLKNQKKAVADATKKLEETRKAFLEKQGSSSTDKAKNIEEQTKIDEELEQAKEKVEKCDEKIEQYLDLHEEAKEKVDGVGESVKEVYSSIKEQERLVKELESGKGGGVAMFGEKAPAMIAKVKDAVKKGKLRGNVFGPVGAFVQIKTGKESWAKLAEAAIGNVGLATFVCDDKADVGLLRRFRKEVNCRDMDIPIAHHHPGARYKTPKGVEGVTGIELAINCLNVEEDLVYNFLLRQRLGRDTASAVKDAKAQIEVLKEDFEDKKEEKKDLEAKQKEHKVKWNQYMKTQRTLQLEIKDMTARKAELKEELEEMEEEDNGEEVDNNLAAELESEKSEAETYEREIKEKERELEKILPEIEEKEAKLNEEKQRNDKVLKDLEDVSKTLAKVLEKKGSYESKVEKAQKKLAERKLRVENDEEECVKGREELDEMIRKSKVLTWKLMKEAEIREKSRSEEGAKGKDGDDDDEEDEGGGGEEEEEVDVTAITDEELEAIERPKITKTDEYYKARKSKYEAELETERKRRKVSESDPQVVWDKLNRAKGNLKEKQVGIGMIAENVNKMRADLKMRRKKWKTFRSHIAKMTNTTFGEMLNKKGSSGEVEFDHRDKTLNLTVQKDSNEASQTSDVKALSGGERSFTTLSLLLALGENLETPFRVMDEFDVFMDAVARKIALDTLVQCATAMVHRQFIFITPQDVSSLTPGPMLKIIKMKPPERNGQTTIN
ncbi:hypothetical protein TrRE_jg10257 [Triparma retinervis]|uniref:RecF/RecN/SMC N-terminal domain-containing protein n=1 Tax=Triparma retinervis TaxID=2557542 RepID=A0A9W6Z3I3_9STRA|nr:hypothetical protein TrRE_jg10257 [Triparma retinervis]